MKTRIIQLVVTLLGCVAAAALSSCQTGKIDEARLAQIGEIALNYAEKKGQITPEDAALAREAGKILLAPTPEQVAATK